MNRDDQVNGLLGLLENIPKNITGKFNIGFGGEVKERLDVVIISGATPEETRNLVESLGGTYDDLGYGFAIVNISPDRIVDLASSRMIQYIELPKSLYTTDEGSNVEACVKNAQSTFNVFGRGVLVGFIDSGIDYTHPAFRNRDGTTRIEYINDLSIGRVFNKGQINDALKSTDPTSIVPSVDLTGHGTHVAGVACAGGAIDTKYYGVAPESSIIMVKAARGIYAVSTAIMKGLKFLVDKSKELNMPLVVNISLSTNEGAHNGTSLLEQYINTVCTLQRISVVIAAGNEGDASHHVGGTLENTNRILFNVGSGESVVVMNLFKSVLPKISIEIISPTGRRSSEIIVEEGLIEGSIGIDNYKIFNTGPKPFDVSGEILIVLLPRQIDITQGQWTVIIRKVNEYNGIFDIWLPITEGLNAKTKFLQPTIFNTLGIPATVSNVISVGSYNYITNTISPFSGRGRIVTYCPVKPDLVAPGEGILGPAPNRSFDSKTGTSIAAPHVTGVCALIVEWGIVRNNDPYLYGDRLKYYLISNARRGRSNVEYPDPSWGYGEVCAYEALNNLINLIPGSLARENKYNEYSKGNIFFRLPKELI